MECACALGALRLRTTAPTSLFLPGTAGTTETWLRGEGRKGRAENVDQMGVAWHWGRGPDLKLKALHLGAPVRSWCLQLPWLNLKGVLAWELKHSTLAP